MPTYTRFKGITEYGEPLLAEQLAINLTEFTKWCFLEVGAFYNFRLNTSGLYGGTPPATLKPVKIPGRTDYRTWQALKNDWVWESGLEYHTQPIQISGVWVNDVLYRPTGGYYLDYRNGSVVFDSAIPANSKVQVEYSARAVHIYDSNINWFKQIQTQSNRSDNQQFGLFGSGVYDILSENRVQLPAIVIEPGLSQKSVGLQLGGGHKVLTDVNYYVIAEQSNERNNIVDTLFYQKDKTIFLYNVNSVTAANNWPLTVRGNIASGAKTYPQMVVDVAQGGYFWKKCLFLDSDAIRYPQSNGLWIGMVSTVCDVDFTGV